jgi:fibronectin-binding autotransporter adhesin
VLAVLLCAKAAAQTTLYWDRDGTTAGAGTGATLSGTWSTTGGTTKNFSTSSAGTASTVNWTSGAIAVFSAGTTAVGQSYTVTVSGTQNVAQIIVEEGDVTFSGGTSINFNNATQAFTVSSGATANVSTIITGTVGMNVNGAGTLTFSNTANTYTGITKITGGGTLSLAALANGGTASSMGSSSNVATNLVLDNGTLQYTGGAVSTNRLFSVGTGGATIDSSGSGLLTLSNTGALGFNSQSGARSLTLTGTGDGSLAAAIGNSGGATSVTKSGAGAWTLSGSNTFSGGVSVTDGTLNISSATAIGTGTLTLAAGTTIDNTSGAALTLTNSNAQTWNGSFTFTGTNNLSFGSGGVTLGATADVTVSAGTLTVGAIADGANTFDLAKSGAGTLTIAGASTFGGSTTISAGTLKYGIDNALPTATAVSISSGATLDLGSYNATIASLTGAGTIDLTGASQNKTLTVGDATSPAAFSGVIQDSGSGSNLSLTKVGSGTLTLSGSASSYTGATTVNAGTLSVSKLANGGSNSSLGAASNSASNLVLNGGTLQYTGAAASTDRLFSVGTSGGTIDASGSGTLSFTNTGSLGFNSQTGARSLTLTGSGTGSLASVIGNNGGATSLVKSGAGTWTLSNASNSYTGTTTITGGTLSINSLANGGSNSALGAAANTATNLVLNGGTLQYTGAAVSTDRLFSVGTSGATIDSSGSGTLTFANTGALGFNSQTGARSLTLMGSANGSLAAVIGDNGGATSLTKSGTGVWTLAGSASNTFTGTTTINAGTLALNKTGGAVAISGALAIGDGSGTDTVRLDAANQIASTAAVTFNNTGGAPTLNLNGYSQTLGSISSTNTAAAIQLGSPVSATTFTVGGDNSSTTFAGVISGGGNAGFAKNGTGTLTLSGTNTFTGAVSINAGTLSAQNNSALGAGTAGTTVTSGAALALQGDVTLSNGNLTLSGTGVSTTGALTNVSGNNTWSGNVTVTGGNATITSQSGTLTLGSTAPLFDISGHTQPTESGYVTIGNQALTFTGSGNVVVNDRIRDFAGQTAGTSYTNATTVNYAPETTSPGSVTVNMTGAGKVTFAANANSYTGTTTVQAGTLVLATASNIGAPHDGTTDSFHAINGALVIGTGSSTTTAAVNLGTGGAANELLSIGTSVTLFKDGSLNLLGNAQTIDALTFTGGTVDVGTGILYLNNNVTVNASAGNTATITGTGSGSVSMTLNRDVVADTGADATRTFTVNHGTGNTYDLTISAILKNGNLVKAGDGTMMLNRNNSYVGTTSVTNGILNIQQGTDGNSRSALGAGDGTAAQGTSVSSGATLQIQGGISVTNERLALSGSGYNPGTGILGAFNNLSGNNTWGTASTTLINLDNDARINSSAGTLTIATNIGSSSNNALTVGGSGNTTISGSINTGIGSTTTVTKDGSGTLTLSGANSYQGATNITAGVVSVQNNLGLGAVSTGSNGTFVTSGAELQLSNAAHGNLTIGGEALTINGAGISSAAGALHNVAGTNSFGGLVTLGSASTIKSDSGTSLTLSGGTSSANYGLTIAGAGNTTISGAMSNGSGSLTKNDSGTFTFAGTSGSTTGTVGKTHLNAGNMVVGNGSATTRLNTAEFDSAAGTTLTIASGGMVVANYASGTTYFSGSIAGTGTYGVDTAATFEKDGAGTLVFDHTFNAGANSTLVLNGGTLSLLGAQVTFGTIHITGNTVLDFNNSAGTFLSSAQLVIDAGVTVTVNNWVSVANNSSLSTVWYATNTVNAGTLAGTDINGGTPLAQVTFTNYGGMTTTWVSGNHSGWFDHEIRPTPEPATYGAILVSGCLGLIGWRRYRRSRTDRA